MGTKLSEIGTVYSELTLSELCSLVITEAVDFEDVAERLEDVAYSEALEGNGKEIIAELKKLSSFFETLSFKNLEVIRYLADIYVLAGDICQSEELYEESIEWYDSAVIADSSYDVPYHSLALTFISMDKLDMASRSLEQEINVEPGNYYSYLMLADIYEKIGDYSSCKRVLNNLIDEDKNNIQGLHKLITYYEKHEPEVDVSLLRKNLVSADKKIVNLDLIIWAYHMIKLSREEALFEYLNFLEEEGIALSIVKLLKGYLYGLKKLFTKKRAEFTEFKRLNQGRSEFMSTKIDEFERVFGRAKADRIRKRLNITRLTITDIDF